MGLLGADPLGSQRPLLDLLDVAALARLAADEDSLVDPTDDRVAPDAKPLATAAVVVGAPLTPGRQFRLVAEDGLEELFPVAAGVPGDETLKLGVVLARLPQAR